MQSSDAIFFAGGSASGLLHSLEKHDLKNTIREIAEKKVYCGISASSHITSKDLALSNPKKIKSYKEMTGFKAWEGLGWVDFYTRSHYTPEKYPEISAELASVLQANIYAIDDETAIKVVDGVPEVVSEGSYKIFRSTS